MATQPDLTDEQRSNLTKLAAYLRTLPAEYPDFEMDLFTQDGQGYGRHIAHKPACGTAACAAGHGPWAGIDPLPGETWVAYSHRAFAERGSGFSWCFDERWSRIDNSAHGAAARIEWMLEHGIPEDADEQRWGDAPLCYRTPADAL